MKKKTPAYKNKGLSLALKLVITSTILLYIFRIIPVSDVITSLASTKPFPFILALFLATCPIIYLSSLRMKILSDAQGMSLSVWKIFEINYITAFYSLFLPGSISGGGVRSYKLSRPDGKLPEAIVSVVFSRLLYNLTAISIGILCFIIDLDAISDRNLGSNLLITALALFLLCLLAFNRKLLLLLENAFANNSLIPLFIRDKLFKLTSSTRKFHDLSRQKYLYILVFCVSEQLLGIIVFFLLSFSLGIDISTVSLGWIRTFLLLAIMLPVSFAGLGVREASLIYLFGILNIAPVEALALSALLFARSVLLGAAGGLMETNNIFIRKNQDKKKKSLTF